MARSVLGSARNRAAAGLLALALWSSLAARPQSPVPSCALADNSSVAEAAQKELQKFQQTLQAGTFYKAMTRQSGKPQSCTAKLDGDTMALSYGFEGGAHLSATTNAKIESSQVRAELKGLTRERAIALLKRGELDAYGKDGCGIDWKRPEEQPAEDASGSHATIFRGDGCNCQARILFQDNKVVAVVLSSAC